MTILFLFLGLIIGFGIAYIWQQKSQNILQQKLTQKETENTFLNNKHTEDLATLTNLEKKYTDAFENLSNKILEEKGKKFTELNQTNIDGLLTPLKEKIKEFYEKIDSTHKENLQKNATFIEKISNLEKISMQMSGEAEKLAKALKGDNKLQGNWGEIILEKILEQSGLREGLEYTKQGTGLELEAINGQRLRPDYIINLPDKKHLIIDSKVSLVAFEKLINMQDLSERQKYAKELVLSLKRHIDDLSQKHYQNLKGLNAPDFVLLFIPIEASFSFAIHEDPGLFQYAWNKKISIVTPTTLMSTLYTISSLWSQENQTKNAEEIAKRSGALYDKFVNFVESLTEIGYCIDKSQKAYENSFKQLSTGKGNLIRQIELIKELGAKTTKSLP